MFLRECGRPVLLQPLVRRLGHFCQAPYFVSMARSTSSLPGVVYALYTFIVGKLTNELSSKLPFLTTRGRGSFELATILSAPWEFLLLRGSPIDFCSQQKSSRIGTMYLSQLLLHNPQIRIMRCDRFRHILSVPTESRTYLPFRGRHMFVTHAGDG